MFWLLLAGIAIYCFMGGWLGYMAYMMGDPYHQYSPIYNHLYGIGVGIAWLPLVLLSIVLWISGSIFGSLD